MKRTLLIVLALALCCTVVYAATEAAKPVATEKEGIAAAVALTKITGIAISPMLGGGVGDAYDYFTCPKGKQDKLPWYARLKFWLPALLLVAVVAIKDGAGVTLPPGWKKPFDVVETVESKVSGLVAAGAVVPSIAAIFHSQLTASADPHVLHAGILGMSFAPLLNILTIPLAVTAFVLVWLVGHVINVLILISPWGGVDAALKGIRTASLAALTAITFIDPWFAAMISLVIVVTAYFIAGWSFRLMVFGSVFTWDCFTFRRKRFTPDPKTNWMFIARKIEKTPIRSYGKLTKSDDGRLMFEYRPWLFFAPRKIAMPTGQYAIGRGLFFPEIMTVDGEKTKSLLNMPPRYKKHEEQIGQIYGIRDIRDVRLLKGLKAIWYWVTGRNAAQPAAAPA
jgi:hypothetical protein